jgi:hypothetical protein
MASANHKSGRNTGQYFRSNTDYTEQAASNTATGSNNTEENTIS